MTKLEYRAVLARKAVGIAGAGGLGSNCAAALARAGVGRLVVADFDLVSGDNLDRQFFFLDQVGLPKVEALADSLARIDPGVLVEPRFERLDARRAEELFRGCDAVVEALDSAEAKAMLIEAALSRLPGVPVIAASGIAGFGRSNDIRERRSGRLVLVGDLESEVGPGLPPMSARVLIAAAMQANAVLEALLMRDAP